MSEKQWREIPPRSHKKIYFTGGGCKSGSKTPALQKSPLQRNGANC